MSDTRVTVRMLPSVATRCVIPKDCVYRDSGGICDDPQINKQNSDSACFKMNNKDVLATLRPYINK